MDNKAIAAISTGLSPSGIGIVRITGQEAIEVADRIFSSPKGIKLAEAESHKAYYGHIVDGDVIIDEVLLLLMRAPHTYTREDTVEINCHGGITVMKTILETVLKNGARPAEPGEFTKRAFLNGRIDLSRAEAVMDVINSGNEYALRNSISQLNGRLYEEIKDIRDLLINRTAYIESALDDPEHYSLDNFGDSLLTDVDNTINKVDNLLRTYDNGRIISEGIKTVIVGKPNVGKSTLLNNILGVNKAIVTDIPGTTRDTIEESVYLDGITLNIIDTAGIRETEDVVERLGVEKSRDNIEDADLCIYVVDLSVPLDSDDETIMSLIKNRKCIVLLNKTDLSPVADISRITNDFEHVLYISAKENRGMEEFKALIKEMFFEGKISFNDEVCITNLRHKVLLEQTIESLKLVKQSILDGMPEDFYTVDLINAYTFLGSIIGESVEDDLVNEIFSKFCMGK